MTRTSHHYDELLESKTFFLSVLILRPSLTANPDTKVVTVHRLPRPYDSTFDVCRYTMYVGLITESLYVYFDQTVTTFQGSRNLV